MSETNARLAAQRQRIAAPASEVAELAGQGIRWSSAPQGTSTEALEFRLSRISVPVFLL